MYPFLHLLSSYIQMYSQAQGLIFHYLSCLVGSWLVGTSFFFVGRVHHRKTLELVGRPRIPTCTLLRLLELVGRPRIPICTPFPCGRPTAAGCCSKQGELYKSLLETTIGCPHWWGFRVWKGRAGPGRVWTAWPVLLLTCSLTDLLTYDVRQTAVQTCHTRDG